MEELFIIQNAQIVEAIVPWFIPFIVIASGGWQWWLIYKIWTKNNISMAVLGMQQSGKTLWYNHLKWNSGIEVDRILEAPGQGGQTVDAETVEKIVLKFPDGRRLKIRKGKDIGGNDENVNTYYKAMIEENDLLLFFFNSHEYINDIMYQRKTNARLWHIQNHIGDKRIILVMSYADQLLDRNKAREQIINTLKRSNLFGISKMSFIVDMTNKDEVEEMKKIVFKKK